MALDQVRGDLLARLRFASVPYPNVSGDTLASTTRSGHVHRSTSAPRRRTTSPRCRRLNGQHERPASSYPTQDSCSNEWDHLCSSALLLRHIDAYADGGVHSIDSAKPARGLFPFPGLFRLSAALSLSTQSDCTHGARRLFLGPLVSAGGC